MSKETMEHTAVPEMVYQHLLSQPLLVSLGTVLADLWYLDQSLGGHSAQERRNLLAAALLRRRFVTDARSATTVSDLWIRLCRLYRFESLRDVLDLVDGLGNSMRPQE